jgi:hypothetical protein
MLRAGLALALILPALLTVEAQSDSRRQRRQDERKAESLRDASQRLKRLSGRSGLSGEETFLHGQASALLERCRQAPAGSYLFDRLEDTLDSLLDAGEDLLEAGRNAPDRSESLEDARRRTARDLEQTYFRVQQGDYFARQSQEKNASEYVRTARRLYQLARSAYDAKEYRRARDLAGASSEVINALEGLAQAAVPIPEPPKLPEG